MEISTIIGIIIAILIILYALKMIFQKPSNAEPSLDEALHIEPESQKPVIPRHVRNQLQPAERVEPSFDTADIVVEETQQPKVHVEEVAHSDEPKLDANKVTLDEIKKAVIDDTTSVDETIKPIEQDETAQLDKTLNVEPTAAKAAPEFSLNVNVEKAEITDFNDESSILDAHLHEQKSLDDESALANAQEFVALNVYPERRVLSGEKTLKVLLKYGLRYGEMRCFHRYSEDNSQLLFSVLEITEDGANGFDLETLSTQEVKGLAFFLVLPHSDVQNAFDTMDSLSRLIAREIEGIVMDQNDQEFTPQLREYWRHQAIDYRPGQTIGT